MAFVTENNITVSFAEFTDVVSKDQRIFEANEGLSDETVDAALVRSTERILAKLRNTQWWKTYYTRRDTTGLISSVPDIPALDPDKILARQSDFTDLCVFTALAEQILPGIADFSDPDSSERQKMAYYTQRMESLFNELVSAGDWYDFDDDGTIESSEKEIGYVNLKRIR